ncbi:MAG: RNA polymerase sigma factor [Alphaproteobacteria bacterium]|nr:RNA polymerase sigma factor [Alphaproteobacteria bacterium]
MSEERPMTTPMAPAGRVEPDDDVLRRAVAGDRDAQGHVAACYYVRMRRWALLHTGAPEIADEVVQEALVRWVRYAHTYRIGTPLQPWMRTLVRNCARDAARPRGVLRFLPWVRPSRQPDREMDMARAADRVLEVMQELTPRQRDLLDLVDLQGLSAADAARALDIEPGTARVHLHEARKRVALGLPGLSDVLEEA